MRILLAGSTGQLGVGCLETALDLDVAIVPLARAVGASGARERLARHAAPECAETAVTGDVTAPDWGLPGDEVERLAGEVDAVVNVAAETSWAAPERRLFGVNVLGAVHGYDLARRLSERAGRAVPYCYASTIFTAGGMRGRIPETRLPSDAHRTAYEQTKWLGEEALLERRGDGYPPLAIARIGGLLGNSVTGARAKSNSLYLIAEHWRRSPRVFPLAPNGRIDVLPRDVAARCLLGAVTAFAGEPDRGAATIFHVCAGEAAHTAAVLFRTLEAADQTGSIPRPRLLPVPGGALQWWSENADRIRSMNAGEHNRAVGMRYLAIDRIFERSTLARLIGSPLPAPSADVVARMAFSLPPADTPPTRAGAPLARFSA